MGKKTKPDAKSLELFGLNADSSKVWIFKKVWMFRTVTSGKYAIVELPNDTTILYTDKGEAGVIFTTGDFSKSLNLGRAYCVTAPGELEYPLIKAARLEKLNCDFTDFIIFETI